MKFKEVLLEAADVQTFTVGEEVTLMHWGETTLETSGEDVKLHSKREEKM